MSFYENQKNIQIEWWKKYTSQPNWKKEEEKWGKHGGKSYPHITQAAWQQLLWKEIAGELPKYLKDNNITAHTATKNLLSSWIASANLYFPSRSNLNFKQLLINFLQSKISTDIIDVENIELEFALAGDLNPEKLLGELDGNRGTGQTSPDVAFIVKTKQGKGLILTECKYTEHSFYPCSARRTTDRGDKPGNPQPKKCLQSADLCNYETIPCHQKVWGRKYLDNFKLSAYGKSILKRCPAATAGYQLLRQQALANGIKESGEYDLVVSAVSFDARNSALIGCLQRTGIPDFQTGWRNIYQHGAEFITWHHQEWVEHVRNHNHTKNDEVNDWLSYMEERYGY